MSRDRFYVCIGSFNRKPVLHIHKNAVDKRFHVTGSNTLCKRGKQPTDDPTNEQLLFGTVCSQCQAELDKFEAIEAREDQRAVG